MTKSMLDAIINTTSVVGGDAKGATTAALVNPPTGHTRALVDTSRDPSCTCSGKGHTPECDAAHRIEMDRRRALVAAAMSGEASTLVPGEDDTTTHRALSEMYDRKRDAQLMSLAKIVGAYGDEMNNREMTAAHAAPMLAEMRKALDRADLAQAKSASHRAAEHAAATRK